MTVQELIDKLSEVEDKTIQVITNYGYTLDEIFTCHLSDVRLDVDEDSIVCFLKENNIIGVIN